jgi:hypothetical protein
MDLVFWCVIAFALLQAATIWYKLFTAEGHYRDKYLFRVTLGLILAELAVAACTLPRLVLFIVPGLSLLTFAAFIVLLSMIPPRF